MTLLLKEKITGKSANVSVIGLGYVGLRLAVVLAGAGFNVLGIDSKKEKVEMLSKGISYLREIKSGEIKLLIDSGRLRVDCSFRELASADVVVVCVPTPLTVNRDPDLSCIESVLANLINYLHKDNLIIIESTVYPGTTEEIVLPYLQRTGLIAAKDFYLAFSPERVDPGNNKYNTKNTPKIVGGYSPECTETASLFYKQVVDVVVPVSSPTTAEMVKVFENSYRAVNIGFVNEMMFLCDRMNINIWEVVEAAGTKPFGIETFYPGPGLGGHCIPVDPFYLAYKARQYGLYINFIELAGQVNLQASEYVINKTRELLNSNNKCLNGSRVIVLGAAYKKNVEDTRESPALKIINSLRNQKCKVSYYDPFVSEITLQDNSVLKSIKLEEEEVREADAVVIVTDHSNVDYEYLVDKAQLVLDTRNATRNVKSGREKIYKI